MAEQVYAISMSMSLTAVDLRKIADAIEEAEQLSFTIESMQIGAHKVLLRRTDQSSSAHAGVPSYKVIGLTREEWAGQHNSTGVVKR